MQLLRQHMHTREHAVAFKVLEWATPQYNEALAWLGAYMGWQAQQQRECMMDGPPVSQLALQRVCDCQFSWPAGQMRTSGIFIS